MVEIYRNRGLERRLARRPEVQAELRSARDQLARVASSILAASHDHGDAYIDTAKGTIDHYVVLNDERGYGAAMTIEYGREGNTVFRSGPNKGKPVPATEPVAPLRTAMAFARARGAR